MTQDEDPGGGNRRTFLAWLTGLSATGLLGTIVYPVVRFLTPPHLPEAVTEQVDAGPLDDAELVAKGYKIVQFGADPVIVVRVSDTEARAFSATCTHLDCIVQYRPEKQLMWCYCHDGAFDLQGRNVAGPPPRPLTPFEVTLVGEGKGSAPTIVVSRT